MINEFLEWVGLSLGDIPLLIIGASTGFLITLFLTVWQLAPEDDVSIKLKMQSLNRFLGKARYVFIVPLFILVSSILYISWNTGRIHRVVGFVDQYSAVFSLLLSGLLVVLYAIQHQSLRKQIQIVDKQVNYARADHKPEIIIEEWTVEDDTITFTLSNIGNGVAKDLGFAVPSSYLSESDSIKIAVMDTGPFPEPVYRQDTDNKVDYLEPGEQHVTFSTKAMVPQTWEEGVKSPVSFSKSLNHFQKLGEEDEQPRIYICPTLVYKDISGDDDKMKLVSEIVNSVAIHDFESAMSTSKKFGVGGDFHPPKNHIVHKDGNDYTISVNSEETLREASTNEITKDVIEHTEPP